MARSFGQVFGQCRWKIAEKGVDFRPSLHLHGDTGACNYYRYFKGLDWSQYQIVKDVHCFLDDKDDDISETATQ